MNATKIRHTVAAAIAVVGIIGPLVLDALGALPWPWVKPVGAILGTLIALCTNGKATAVIGPLIDVFTANQAAPTPASEAPTKPTDVGPGPKAAAILALVFGLGLLLAAAEARADVTPQALGCVDKANTYCVVPATAVGWQLNLKDGSAKNAVMLLGLVLQHEFGTLPLGLGAYLGLGETTDSQGSYQGCIGVSVTNWGLLCGGVRRVSFPDGSAWQGMLTFAPQLTYGGSPSYVKAAGGAR